MRELVEGADMPVTAPHQGLYDMGAFSKEAQYDAIVLATRGVNGRVDAYFAI
jgi:hypothetical protein